MNRLKEEKTSGLMVFVFICFSAMAIFISSLSAINIIYSAFLASFKFAAVALLFFAIIFALFHREACSFKLFAATLFALSFLIKSMFALAIETQPESDFLTMFNAANFLANGINIMPDDLYFQTWSYQSAFVVWMAMFIRLFGADLVFFKLLNCLLSALSTLFIYLLARRFSSERGARISAVLFMCYPGTFFLVTVLTPQHLSEFLILAAVYVYTSPSKGIKKKLLVGGIAGVILALSNAIRPVGTLVLAAIAVYTVLKLCVWIFKRQSSIAPLVAKTAVFVAVYFMIFAGISGLFKLTGLNENGLTNSLPEWKIIVGLNEESDGQYNREDEQAVFGDTENRDETVKELMRERLSISPSGFLSLAFRKSYVLWGSFEPSWWAFTGNVYEEVDKLGVRNFFDRAINISNKLGACLYICMNVLMSVGAISVIRTKRYNEVFALLVIIALAYFSAHLIVEVQIRYRSLMTVVTAPLIAPGAEAVLSLFKGSLFTKRDGAV